MLQWNLRDRSSCIAGLEKRKWRPVRHGVAAVGESGSEGEGPPQKTPPCQGPFLRGPHLSISSSSWGGNVVSSEMINKNKKSLKMQNHTVWETDGRRSVEMHFEIWREQTAAFLFCHLTFWWGDVRRRPFWGGYRWGRGSFSGVTPNPARGNCSTVTQSYSVHTTPSTVTQDALLWNLPVHGTVLTSRLFSFCLLLNVASSWKRNISPHSHLVFRFIKL